jgi:hypothetical protein
MSTQNYKNHLRFYAPHHFIFLPLMCFLIGIGIYKYNTDAQQKLIWGLFSVLSFCILYLAVMLRQHYALNNQNRIVRLEFYLRYFQLSGKKYDDNLDKLSFAQIAALRFAPDIEFLILAQKAMSENTIPDDIKKAIVNWKPDHMRV